MKISKESQDLKGNLLSITTLKISDETKAEIDDEDEEAVVSFSERYYNNQQTARSERGPGFLGHSHSQGLDHSQQYGNTGYGVSSPGIQNVKVLAKG